MTIDESATELKRWELLICETGLVRTFDSHDEARSHQERLARLGFHALIGRRDDRPMPGTRRDAATSETDTHPQ